MRASHVPQSVCSAAVVPCDAAQRRQSIARAKQLGRELQGCRSADEKARTFRLMRAAFFSALAPKRDGTHPIYQAPLELEVI